ncbi:SLATT-fungal domain-containing protein [Mycena chlorophos]|uniref:SLATT-fungal domain-containing protein n=1 Tax=Mycena chlorophos TaxID=658473 RepID=A0A8H6SUI6_MYCCL|nr:SLATT-fungal domain-containing protein [Mycena chlorophos]
MDTPSTPSNIAGSTNRNPPTSSPTTTDSPLAAHSARASTTSGRPDVATQSPPNPSSTLSESRPEHQYAPVASGSRTITAVTEPIREAPSREANASRASDSSVSSGELSQLRTASTSSLQPPHTPTQDNTQSTSDQSRPKSPHPQVVFSPQTTISREAGVARQPSSENAFFPRPATSRTIARPRTEAHTPMQPQPPLHRSLTDETRAYAQAEVQRGEERPGIRRADSAPTDEPQRAALAFRGETSTRAWIRTQSPEMLPFPQHPERIEVRPPGTNGAALNSPNSYVSGMPSPAPATGPQPPPKPISIYRQNSASVPPRSELDWIVPRAESSGRSESRPKTLEERLRPTIEAAKIERDHCKVKALYTGYSLNAAIGLQVVFGALTTGLSAALSGHKVSIMTAVLGLGGMSTILASYLARVRGSNEPEVSIARGKDLEGFIRECEVFVLDHGHVTGPEFDDKLAEYRNRFEEMMGNERRLSGP